MLDPLADIGIDTRGSRPAGAVIWLTRLWFLDLADPWTTLMSPPLANRQAGSTFAELTHAAMFQDLETDP